MYFAKLMTITMVIASVALQHLLYPMANATSEPVNDSLSLLYIL